MIIGYITRCWRKESENPKNEIIFATLKRRFIQACLEVHFFRSDIDIDEAQHYMLLKSHNEIRTNYDLYL
jgi:hypothetical protein